MSTFHQFDSANKILDNDSMFDTFTSNTINSDNDKNKNKRNGNNYVFVYQRNCQHQNITVILYLWVRNAAIIVH